GQRLLDDAVRARRASGPRLGIFGTRIGHSRSPRIHRPPFDRLDLPEDAPLGELLDALRPHYRGFAITSPFKKAAAARLGGALEAVNTVVRRGDGWAGFNTDVAGAEAVLLKLGSRTVSVLGEGGVATALRTAASDQGVALHFVRRASIPREPLTGAAVWTWPDGIAAPEGLSFRDARVAVVAYGAAARRIAAEIASRGGHPLLLGARWFIAQARRQRQLWETA
ncbi:MAG TPA: shikimate dehydrogenase, partial [Myxococcaceae bacterium]|nr:shikimate dehydrogenase [Myxococcaceae bacterium]